MVTRARMRRPPPVFYVFSARFEPTSNRIARTRLECSDRPCDLPTRLSGMQACCPEYSSPSSTSCPASFHKNRRTIIANKEPSGTILRRKFTLEQVSAARDSIQSESSKPSVRVRFHGSSNRRLPRIFRE